METEPDGMGAAEGNTQPASGATSITHEDVVASSWWRRVGWVEIAILLIAAALRLAFLELKPPHFDEGVNGYFVDDMTKHGFYHYDPTNFHGPLHFYVLFLAQTLFGRHVWALRLPLVIASIGCVAFLLFGFRRFISARASRIAAAAMAVSPGFVFYARYAIHETWLVLFLMLLVAGIAGLWCEGRKRDLWLVAMGFAGIVTTKETWLIHLVALGLAGVALWILERISPSADLPPAYAWYDVDDIARAATIAAGFVVFFYSGALIDPSGLVGFVHTYTTWVHTGTGGQSGHEKEWWYWFQLLGTYEWPVSAGVIAALCVVIPRTNRFVRWLAIAALGTLVAYAIIPYKTPWCVISWAWPFLILFGVAVEWMVQRLDRWTIGGLGALLGVLSLAKTLQLNFVRYSDESELYVYVQTTKDIRKLLGPLEWQLRRDPTTLFRSGHMIQEEHHPYIWLFGDRPNVTYGDHNDAPTPLDADWLVVDSLSRDRIEEGLSEPYFRESVQLRGMAPDRSFLYLRAASFADYFKGREPEFQPHTKPASAPVLEEPKQ